MSVGDGDDSNSIVQNLKRHDIGKAADERSSELFPQFSALVNGKAPWVVSNL
jgi:hypothetical protein